MKSRTTNRGITSSLQMLDHSSVSAMGLEKRPSPFLLCQTQAVASGNILVLPRSFSFPSVSFSLKQDASFWGYLEVLTALGGETNKQMIAMAC